MPLKPYHGFTAVCPVCGASPEMGADYHPVFKTRAEAAEWLQDTDGETLEEKIAYSCTSGCGDIYYHRRCMVRPCGYCASKAGGWLDALRKAAAQYTALGPGRWFVTLWWWSIVDQAMILRRAKERRQRDLEWEKEQANAAKA